VANRQASPFVRGPIARAILTILLSLVVLLPVIGAAEAANVPRKYAGIVLDAKSGNVLYESNADGLRYPASVTKVMTLYVLFQELAAGNLTLDTKMTVSRHAAAAVPTKLGLRAGATIRVEDAIKALVTISANDIARVVAEHISGSESKFARRMTQTAAALGMSHTTYENASGLPDSGQITTVRDQAVLAVAIYQHFPTYYEYFQTSSFHWGKRTYGNHNNLLGKNGVDGIKTGYIRASGYNLMTAARDDGRHIVVIGFGFDSGSSRDAKVRELVREYLPQARRGDYLQAAMVPQPGQSGGAVQYAANQPVDPMPYPAFRGADDPIGSIVAVAAPEPEAPEAEVVLASLAPMPAEPIALDAVNAMGADSSAPVPAYPSEDIIGAWISEELSLGAAPAPLGQTRASTPLVPPVGIGDDGEAIDLMTSGSIDPSKGAVALATTAPATVATTTTTSPGDWVVQIGAAPNEQGANALLSDATTAVSGLGSFRSFVEQFEKNGQTYYRARFSGFGGRDAATEMCSELKKANLSCLAMQS
jgi:D-alanyl-D-alanine carboxypeptidase